MVHNLELGSYRLYSRIGKAYSGGGDVWAGQSRDSADAAPLALRLCPLDQTLVPFSLLFEEVRMLRSLQHPNILSCIRAFVHDTDVVIVTPLHDYGSVTDVMQAEFLFGLPEKAAALILGDVLTGLAYLHSRDKIHRGVRCSHILLSSEGGGRGRLSGLRHSTSLLHQGRRRGRLHEFSPAFVPGLLWLAPEVLAQNVEGYDLLSDVYSLGVAAVEMANGFPPFADMDHMQMMMEKLRGTTPRLLDATTVGEVKAGKESDHQRRLFSQAFHSFTESALQALPHRWTINALQNHPFIKQARKQKHTLNDFLQPTVKPLVLRSGAKKGSKAELPSVEKLTLSDFWDF